MSIYYSDFGVTVHHGDCLDVLATLPDASVHAVCTDPPYGIRFMGKAWDGEDIEAGVSLRRSQSAMPDDGKAGANGGYRSAAAEAGRYDLSANAAFGEWCRQWATECLRVLKPGGYLLVFGGSRTWHRLAAAVEDAGFEIRDSIAWLYAQGFPKSLNIASDSRFCQCEGGDSSRAHGDDAVRRVRSGLSGLAADAAPGEVPDLLAAVQRESSRAGLGDTRAQGESGPDSSGTRLGPGEDERPAQSVMEGRGNPQAPEGQLRRPCVRAVSTGLVVDGSVGRVRDGAPFGDGAMGRPAAASDGVREPHQPQPTGQQARELGALPVERGSQARRGWPLCSRCGKPSVPSGLGTALKPGFEPIVVARKPLAGTVAGNVLEHRAGGLNIGGCRIEIDDAERAVIDSRSGADDGQREGIYSDGVGKRAKGDRFKSHVAGRWPTNVVLTHASTPDGVDLCGDGCVPGCLVLDLDEQSGDVGRTGATVSRNRATIGDGQIFNGGRPVTTTGHADSGGASRFFPVFRFEAKAPASERPRVDGVAHPTVKPLALMRWLVRLVTPPGGVLLDPFLGSGTTAQAARAEGFQCVGIEREESYLPLIKARLDGPGDDLFSGGDVA